jgi:HK97 family phage major capsid protein
MGVWTAITATTNPAHLVSTTAATIGLVDIHTMYAALPPRHCKNASWLMHSNYSLVVKALGTAISVSCSMDITQAPSDRLLGKKLYESDDSPSTQTTTALDPELLLGDFSRYIMVDRIGMTAELVAHLVGTNHRPTGQRGLARWRSGGAVVDTRAFRQLADKTSA